MIITIAGKAGSGKTTLAKTIIKNFSNATHIDLDDINSNLLSTKEVQVFALSVFGKEVFKDGVLNKDRIADLIYSNKNMYDKWVHFMQEKCEQYVVGLMDESPDSVYIIEHVLVNKLELFEKSACKILVYVEENERLKRVMKRDNLTLQQAKSREQFLQKYNEHQFDIVYNAKEDDDIMDKINNALK